MSSTFLLQMLNDSSMSDQVLDAVGGVGSFQANVLYVVFGSVLAATNLIIFSAIMRHRALRNHKVPRSELFFGAPLYGCPARNCVLWILVVCKGK